MSQVFVTTYEIVGAGIPIADEHYSAEEAAKGEHWAFTERVGGKGFRPDHNGGVRSVLFEEMPAGWRKTGRDRGFVEAVPRKDSKAGKGLVAEIAALPRAPRPDALAAKLGYSPSEMALDSDRGTIYFPTAMRLHHPVERTFLRLPRFAKDGFEPDDATLRALPESEFMRAIEDHNAEARRVREGQSS